MNTVDRNGWVSLQAQEPTEADCLDGCVIAWHVFQGTMVEQLSRLNANRMFTHWMPIATAGWISAADRLPTEDDADVTMCVLAIHTIDGIRVTGWHRIGQSGHYTHWMHAPDQPVGYREQRKLF